MRAVSQEIPQPLTTKISLKITHLKFSLNLPADDESGREWQEFHTIHIMMKQYAMITLVKDILADRQFFSLLPGPVFVTIIHPYMQTLHWGAATREISRPIYSMVIRSEILKIILMNNNDNLMTSCHWDAFHVTLLWEETTSRLWIPPKKPFVQSLQLSFQLF